MAKRDSDGDVATNQNLIINQPPFHNCTNSEIYFLLFSPEAEVISENARLFKTSKY